MAERNIADTHADPTRSVKIAVRWLALVGGAVFAGTFVIGGIASMIYDSNLYQVALQQVPATIGLPSAALASLCLVIVLENTSGPIEFEGLGFKFKGASGPVVLWCLCFLVMTVAIQMVWVAPG